MVRGLITLMTALVAHCGCSSDAGIEYLGEVGVPTPISHRNGVLWVSARVDGADPQPVLVDTGLPFTSAL